MNRLTIIGNLTHDPELRTTPSGDSVCSFSVAVNRRSRRDAQGNQNEQVDFFRVSAWRQLGENCAKYLDKGRKVAVVGTISTRAYQGKDGSPRASLELTADDVEFLSPKSEQTNEANAVTCQPAAPSGYVEVTGEDELPF